MDKIRFEIATKVMSLEVFQATEMGYEELIDYADKDPKYDLFYWGRDYKGEGFLRLPYYTHNMSDAWQVVERVTQPPTNGEFRVNDTFAYWFARAELYFLTEQEAATAICSKVLELLNAQL